MTALRHRSNWIPWALAGLFLPVIAVNLLLVHLALSSNTGLVSDAAFDTGQSYNRIIAAGQQQHALGWRAEVTLTKSNAADAARITLVLLDSAGRRMGGVKITGRLYSPVDPLPDQSVSLVETADQDYAQELSLPRRGQWDAQLIAHVVTSDGVQDFAIDQRLVLR